MDLTRVCFRWEENVFAQLKRHRSPLPHFSSSQGDHSIPSKPHGSLQSVKMWWQPYPISDHKTEITVRGLPLERPLGWVRVLSGIRPLKKWISISKSKSFVHNIYSKKTFDLWHRKKDNFSRLLHSQYAKQTTSICICFVYLLLTL